MASNKYYQPDGSCDMTVIASTCMDLLYKLFVDTFW